MTNAVLSDSRLHSLIDADRFELRLPDVPNAEAWGKRKQHLRTQLGVALTFDIPIYI